jgi:hypothetical protein
MIIPKSFALPLWIGAFCLAMLGNVAHGAPLAKFEIGNVYRLVGSSSKLTPSSVSYCNIDGSIQNNCHLGVRSTFEILSINAENSKVTLVVRHRYSADAAVRECKTLFGNFKDTEYCRAALRVATADSDKLAGEGLVFSHDMASLLAVSEGYVALVEIGLKAVLVPQKIYGRNYQHSTNQTIGVAISGSMPGAPRDSGFHLLTSADYGIGFNQVTIEANGTLVERVGLSVFGGYDIRDTRKNNTFGIGVYIGVDYVELKQGELFAGLPRRHRPWLGLVLSTSLN